jgi:hypothetical protein
MEGEAMKWLVERLRCFWRGYHLAGPWIESVEADGFGVATKHCLHCDTQTARRYLPIADPTTEAESWKVRV